MKPLSKLVEIEQRIDNVQQALDLITESQNVKAKQQALEKVYAVIRFILFFSISLFISLIHFYGGWGATTTPTKTLILVTVCVICSLVISFTKPLIFVNFKEEVYDKLLNDFMKKCHKEAQTRIPIDMPRLPEGTIIDSNTGRLVNYYEVVFGSDAATHIHQPTGYDYHVGGGKY